MLIPSLLSAGGCSFLFTETLPDNPSQLKYFDCTNTPGLAVADGVIAVANGVSGAMTLAEDKAEFEEDNNGLSPVLVGSLTLGFAAVMVASGIYGFVHAENCRHAKNELESRLLSPPPEVKQRTLTPEPSATQPAGQAGEIKMLEIPPEQAPAPAP